MAGGVKPEADHEIMIVRPKKKPCAKSPLLPDQADPSELIKVRLRDVLEGERSQNIEVLNLDTIFVPKIKVFYVTGEVKRPGQYTFMKGMTALQAISTAGGFTEKAAKKKVKIGERKGRQKGGARPFDGKPHRAGRHDRRAREFLVTDRSMLIAEPARYRRSPAHLEQRTSNNPEESI